jgi:uncharacterized protein YPO0396
MASLQDTQQNTLTQANSILDREGMTLEEKLEAINKAMADNAAEFNKSNPGAVPIDPMDALHCEGCQ